MKSVLAILLSSAMIAGCQTNDKTTQHMPLTGMLKTEQSNISYTVCGQSEKTLFFLHGWNIDQSYWTDQQKRFSGDYKIVTMDLPGFGQSVNLTEKYSIAAYVKDVRDLIAHLNLKNVILVGHSMGGRVVLEAAQDHKEIIALVGVDNFKSVRQELTDTVRQEVSGFLEWLESDFTNNAATYADQYLLPEVADSVIRNRIVNDYRSANKEASIAAIKAYLYYNHEERERLSLLEIPLYIISSNMSPVDTIGLEKTGLHYKVYSMAGTGHFPMVERPKQFNDLLNEALKRLAAK